VTSYSTGPLSTPAPWSLDVPIDLQTRLVVQVIDGAGNVSALTAKGVHFNAIDIQASIVGIFDPGLPTTLTVTIFDLDDLLANAQSISYVWDLGDGRFDSRLLAQDGVLAPFVTLHPDSTGTFLLTTTFDPEIPSDITTTVTVSDDAGAFGSAVLVLPRCGTRDNDAAGGPFGGTPPWIADGTAPDGLTTGADPCDPDDDNSGCIDTQEPLENPPRDPLNPWDWADMWTPALPASGTPVGGRSKGGSITLADVGAVIAWVGATNNNPSPNVTGRDYDADVNANGVEDGAEYDRTPVGIGLSGPPNGAVSLQDASVVLAQVGDAC